MRHCDWALVRVRAEDGSELGAGAAAKDRDQAGAKVETGTTSGAEDEADPRAQTGTKAGLGLKQGLRLGLELELNMGLKLKPGADPGGIADVKTGAVAEDGTGAGPGAEDRLGLKLG